MLKYLILFNFKLFPLSSKVVYICLNINNLYPFHSMRVTSLQAINHSARFSSSTELSCIVTKVFRYRLTIPVNHRTNYTVIQTQNVHF
jgi:hypothetical protein